MATPAMSPAGAPASKSSRGKDQIQWSEDVWGALDQAVSEEMMRTRVGAKFLPQVHVDRKITNVASDVVVIPGAPGQPPPPVPFDPALSVDESQTNRVNEYWTTFKLSVSQVQAEGADAAAPSAPASSSSQGTGSNGQATMSRPHRASTACSLALRTANILAQAEDLVLFNGQNAVVNSPLFAGSGSVGPFIQFLDPNLKTNLDLGVLNIEPIFSGTTLTANDIQLPVTQVVPVHPQVPGTSGSAPQYLDFSLDAIAAAYSMLQGATPPHYGNYALVLNDVPYADMFFALKNTLVQTIQPVQELVKAGIYGTGTLPPFVPYPPAKGPTPAGALAAGLPTTIGGKPLSSIPGFSSGSGVPNVLYTGALICLTGNTVDMVRGQMDDSLDAMVTFNQKDQNEQYRFRVVQRFTLRLKDPTAVILLLYLDS